MPLYDFNCPKCNIEEIDIIADAGEVNLVCPGCGAYMRKTPGIGHVRSEHPDYAQSEALQTMDPNVPGELGVMKRAAKGQVTSDEWNGIMKAKDFHRTDSTELDQARKIREKNKRGETHEEHQAGVERLQKTVQEKNTVTVSGTRKTVPSRRKPA